MESEFLRGAPRIPSSGWMTVLALAVLAVCLLACLYVLVGFPAQAQVTGSTLASPAVTPAYPVRRAAPVYAPPSPAPETSSRNDAALDKLQAQTDGMHEQWLQSQENLREAARSQARLRVISTIFLAVFAIIAAVIVLQVYLQGKRWDREASGAVEEVQAIAARLNVLHESRQDMVSALPALLQEVGEQPLAFQEDGSPFAPRSRAIIDDIDHLAYVGSGRLAFRDLQSQSEAAVYLNGLLLSAVSHLNRNDPWTAFARLDQFFERLTRFPDVLDRRRLAQGHSYRALAGYLALEEQDRIPSWLRRADRAQAESVSKQAFADVARAAAIDPEWRHSHFVEALLCSRFYLSDEGADNASRSELHVRGLRRAVSLYKQLIEDRAYRGPARRNLVRALKRIAEQTGEKADFSDFGFALNSFPADEELADEALAARVPATQDRFLWQWLLGDEELFANVERLNQAEYRAFWIRTLDHKVHLRNWRADLEELQQARPAMKEWSIQLLQAEPPISLSEAISRRQDRFESPASGA